MPIPFILGAIAVGAAALGIAAVASSSSSSSSSVPSREEQERREREEAKEALARQERQDKITAVEQELNDFVESQTSVLQESLKPVIACSFKTSVMLQGFFDQKNSQYQPDDTSQKVITTVAGLDQTAATNLEHLCNDFACELSLTGKSNRLLRNLAKQQQAIDELKVLDSELSSCLKKVL